MSTKIKALRTIGAQTLQNYLRLGATEAPKYINKVKEEVIYKKANDLNSWYTRILGLDEVKLYQERVVMLQEKLLGVQDRRRSISQELTEIRKKSTELQDQIHKVKRNDDLQRFLDLMREETEILKMERAVNAKFLECDREEREVFTAFTNAVRDSHEKQRAQLEYTKYFGLILSILGSFLAFCYSSLRKQDLKNFITENVAVSSQTSEQLMHYLQSGRKPVDSFNNLETSTILKRVDDNYKTIIQILDESKNSANKTTLLSDNNKKQNISNILPNTNSVVVGGCAAVLGFFILRNLFG